MKRTRLLSLAFVILATTAASAQTTPPSPPAPAPPPAQPAHPAPMTFTTNFFFGDNFLGVSVEEVTRENAGRYKVSGEPRGVGVKAVIKDSPAARAGLREGDVIVRFDGEAVTSTRKLNRLIEESAPEHAARLTVLRGGSEQEVTATLGKREGFAMAPAAEFGFDSDALKRLTEDSVKNSEQWKRQGEEMQRRLEELRRARPEGDSFPMQMFAGRRIGVSTDALGRQLADYFGVQHGVLVNSVEENSPAWKAGIRAGDIITEADGQKIDEPGDLSGAIGRREEGEVTLTVVRDRKSRTVRVTPERRQMPQGLFGNPGAFHVVQPVATIKAPRVSPRLLPVPRVRAFRTPGSRVL
ncbi:MAG TPA: PDZ domain-containing protein [Pyrinomonadaceae bacterium]|jgi:serine protease Do|nr:PDZ domain-containing protein [Pyrinomonadaceae bacterium]